MEGKLVERVTHQKFFDTKQKRAHVYTTTRFFIGFSNGG